MPFFPLKYHKLGDDPTPIIPDLKTQRVFTTEEVHLLVDMLQQSIEDFKDNEKVPPKIVLEGTMVREGERILLVLKNEGMAEEAEEYFDTLMKFALVDDDE